MQQASGRRPVALEAAETALSSEYAIITSVFECQLERNVQASKASPENFSIDIFQVV